VLKDPLQHEGAAEGLDQLCEEGATQLFRPLRNNDLILGAVGPLQFDVVAFRLAGRVRRELRLRARQRRDRAVDRGADEEKLEQFRERAHENLALDHAGELVYLAPTAINLGLTVERWPDLCSARRAKHLRGWRREARPAAPARDRLGPLRLGELRVRDDGDGRVLPGVLQAVLERGGEAAVSTFRLGLLNGAGSLVSRCPRRSSARWRTGAARASSSSRSSR
jgi:hypothetical protein